jgi:hypothetical protein
MQSKKCPTGHRRLGIAERGSDISIDIAGRRSCAGVALRSILRVELVRGILCRV